LEYASLAEYFTEMETEQCIIFGSLFSLSSSRPYLLFLSKLPLGMTHHHTKFSL